MLAHIPTLESARLVLRAGRHADIDDVAAFYADPVSTRFIGGVLSRAEAWRGMAARAGAWILRGYGYFAVDEKASGCMVGFVGPWFPEGWPEPELGWALFPAARGRGYATEAVGCARDFAYRELGWSTAISLINPQNAPSLAVAARLGAKRDGTFVLHGTEIGIFRHPSPQELDTLSTQH